MSKEEFLILFKECLEDGSVEINTYIDYTSEIGGFNNEVHTKVFVQGKLIHYSTGYIDLKL